MASDADKRCLDQVRAEVMNAELDVNALMGQSGEAWKDAARMLQQAMLKHAKDDEEADDCPRLRKKLSAPQTSIVTSEFRIRFAAVKPAAVV